MTRKLEDFKGIYKSLSRAQKDLVKILTLIDSPEDKTKILQICQKAKLRPQPQQSYNIINLGQTLEFLRSMQLVKKNLDQKYLIHPQAYNFAIQKVLSDKQLSTLRKSVTIIYPGIKAPHQAHRYPQQVIRDASFALYNNDYKSFQTAISILQKDNSFYTDQLYKKLFIERLGIANIPNLSPEFQFEFYKSQLGEMILMLKNVDLPLKSIQKISNQLHSKDLDLINYYVSIHALLKGDWQTIYKLWEGKDSVDALKFKGWLYFAQGYNIKALNRYEKALKKYRKKEKSLKGFFQDYHGVIFILALLKDSNTKHISLIKDFFKEIFSQSHTISNVHLYLSSIVDYLQDNTERAQELFEQEHLYYNLHGLLYLYAQYWTQCFAPNWENYALTLQHKAIKNGYYWVAYNVAVLMQAISTQRPLFYATKVEELQEIVGKIPSLLDVIGIQEEWEIALQALEALHNHYLPNQNNQQSRLIWLVDFEQDIIQPKIQRINKNGSWSKGRNALLDKLLDGTMSEITPHDLRVINTISKASDVYHNGNNSYGFYTPNKTFKALVDHPLLFLYKSPEIACELRQGLVELVIKETSDGYSIRPSIDIQQEGYYIIKETPTRYQFIQVNEKQVQLAQALGGTSLTIPFKGKAQLERTLAGLSTIMPLQSDLEFQSDDIPSVEPDNRLYVHLLPVGEGFDVEFFVKPFQVSAPYFKPGKGSARVVAKIEAIRTQTKRDLEAEVQAFNQLINACDTLKEIHPSNDLWQLESPHICLQLLHELEPFKMDNLIVIEWPKGEQLKIKQQITSNHLKLSIRKNGDWFGLSGKIQVNENLILEMRHLLNMMQEQQSEFIELDDGQFLALSKDLQQRLDNIYKYTDEEGNIHPLASFAFEDLTAEMHNIETDEAWNQHIEALKAIEEQSFPIPTDLQATLRSYQQEGFQWLSKLATWGVGACLADDMGLGKTIQALTLILKRSSNGPSLVVAPASVCRNWVKEIQKFAPSLEPVLFSESDRQKSIQQAMAHQVIITTYGLLQTESDLFETKTFETIVLDEAQAIKNSNAKRSQAAMKLKGNFKIITTGTPIENHLGELWNLFRFINPGLLGSLKSFKERFAIPIEKERSVETQQQLQNLIRPFILRRHKKEVLKELPEKTEIVLSVNLSDEEQAFYEALRRNAVESLEKDKDQKAGTKHLKVLAQIMRLRRACCNPQLVDPNSTLKSSKLTLFGQIVTELIANGHKALIFSQFVGHLQLIEQYIKQKNIRYQYLDGQTPAKKRQERIDAFQNGVGELFLISLKAGGTGLNLTAADYVIHMDPWWNPAVEDQASDRAHRIGQQRPVTVYRLITENTIEEKIIKLHENKRDLADSLLEGTDASSKLSVEDLLNLIKNN